MRNFVIIIALLFTLTGAFGQSRSQKDFNFYWQTIHDNFAYFDKQKTNWEQVKRIYQPRADTITSKRTFVQLLEQVNNELYNGHVFLNTNTPSSNRTIPSGADIKAVYAHHQFTITEIREGFNADQCGLKTGMIVTRFNGVAVQQAIQKFIPKAVTNVDDAMYEFAINSLLAGTHNTKRKITVIDEGVEKTFEPDAIPNRTEQPFTRLLDSKLLPHNIGYIRINNSLGNSDLIKAFDMALDSLKGTKALILDLRETPSGGNTTTARAIMGRFISKEMPYQKHIYVDEEKETGIRRSTLELVSPRLSIYSKPLVVLVSYWTGSMGEGLAIGFDGMKRAKVAGTPMAGLLGEIFSFKTPELQIPFSFPCVKLQHINGQPREDFRPPYVITNQKQAISFAVKLIN